MEPTYILAKSVDGCPWFWDGCGWTEDLAEAWIYAEQEKDRLAAYPLAGMWMELPKDRGNK